MSKFIATAPDGTEIKFASKTRTYTHAVLTRRIGEGNRWKLFSRVGRIELLNGSLGAADRHLNCDGRWDALKRKWVYTPKAERAVEVVAVPVEQA